MNFEGLSRRVHHLAERLAGDRSPLIALYHHVADVAADPWELAVSPHHFEKQIAMLARAFEVVPLTEIKAGRASRKPLAAITFDDGYRDVATVAAPILERFDCPATVFLTTGAIGGKREFWWDELCRVVIESGFVGEITFTAKGRAVRQRLELGYNQRRRAHMDIWTRLAPLEARERSDILEALAAQTGTDLSPRPSHAIMSADDVAGLKGGMLSVGAHTVTHPNLPDLECESQWREISQSRRDCEALTGEAPEVFAYPHGTFTAASVDAVRAAGFTYGVTCKIDFVRADNDDALLPRFPTRDCGGLEMLLRLS